MRNCVMKYKLLLAVIVFHATILNANCKPSFNVDTGTENADRDDCQSDEGTDASGNQIANMPSNLRVLQHPLFRETQSDKTETKGCPNTEESEELLIEDGINYLSRQIAYLEANAQLSSAMKDAREVFDDVSIVHESLSVYWKEGGPTDLAQAEYDCRSRHPTNALTKMVRRVRMPPNLFKEVVDGSRFDETVFNATASIYITEVAIGAILAEKCNKILHPNASTSLENRKNRLNEKLRVIVDAIVSAREYLLENYQIAVSQDIEEALAYIDKRGMSRKEGATYIYHVLSNKYKFRVWAVEIYRYIRQNAVAVHAHEGTMANWSMFSNRHHTVIAHSSERNDVCSNFSDIVRGKKLRDIIGDDAVYDAFVVEEPEHLGWNIMSLRRLLRPHKLPHNHFISIVTFRSTLHAEFDEENHLFEVLRHPHTGKPFKTLLIGWC